MHDLWAIQKALYEALSNDAALMALVEGIHDAVPQRAPLPYIVFSRAGAKDWSSKTTSGMEATFRLHVYSQKRGHKEAALIQKRIAQLIDAGFAVDGYDTPLIRIAETRIDKTEGGRLIRAELDLIFKLYSL